MQGIRAAAAVALCGVAALAGAGQAPAQTLSDALVDAYRNSNLLEQNRAVLRAADEDVAVANASLRPVVNFIGRVNATRRPSQMTGIPTTDISGTLALSAEITLIDFGRGKLSVDAAKESVLATREALVGVEQRVLLSAVDAFMSVRSANETAGLRESNLRLITQELRAARDRFEVGEITRTDVAIAESRLAASRSNLAAAEGDRAVAREAYKAATGSYPGTLSRPPALPAIPPSLDEAMSIARNTHPAIRQAQHEVAAAAFNVERAALAGAGQVGASGDVSLNDSGNTTTSVGLSYSRPIYQGGRLPALHRQAMARRDAQRAALHQTVAEVLQQVGQAWSNLSVATARIEASERQIAAAQTAYDGVRQEAELGARTTLDVLNAEQELLDARAARIAAEAGQYVAVYTLLSAMGLLTVEHLNLGIPTYDPAAYYNAVQDAPMRSPQGESLDRVLRSIGRP